MSCATCGLYHACLLLFFFFLSFFLSFFLFFLLGGVTTIQVLPGSANVIGGEGVLMKLRDSIDVFALLLRNAPRVMKVFHTLSLFPSFYPFTNTI